MQVSGGETQGEGGVERHDINGGRRENQRVWSKGKGKRERGKRERGREGGRWRDGEERKERGMDGSRMHPKLTSARPNQSQCLHGAVVVRVWVR